MDPSHTRQFLQGIVSHPQEATALASFLEQQGGQTAQVVLTALTRLHLEAQGRLTAIMGGLHILMNYKHTQLCPWAATIVKETAARASDPALMTLEAQAEAGLELMAVHCPACGELLDQSPSECSAFFHRPCNAHFCFVCFRSCSDSSACHNHVLDAHGNLYMVY